MNDSRTEYLGANGNGNGQTNGNGHDKNFGIHKIEDPLLSKIVPQARRQCCEDTRLTEGARMLYCWLTDASLLFGVYIRRGIVKFADADLARKFMVNSKTIRNWKRALAATGRIWISERWNKNSFPTTVYNISAIVGQPELPLNVESQDGSLVDHDTFSSSNRHPGRFLQRSSSNGKFLCRLHGVAGCAVCRRGRGVFSAVPPEAGKTQELTVNKEPEENILPRTTAMNYRAPRQPIAAHHGKYLPTPTATDCRVEGKPVAADNGNHLPLPTATICREGRQSVAGNGKAGDVSLESSEIPFKRSTGFNALKSAGGAKKLTPENIFLMDVAAVMEQWRKGSSKAELANSGGWWRMAFRADPSLMRRVLNDIRCIVREGKIKTNPGATAVDLWKRWDGEKSLSNPKLKKAAVKAAA